MKKVSAYRTPDASLLDCLEAAALLSGSPDPEMDLDGQDLDYGFGGDW